MLHSKWNMQEPKILYLWFQINLKNISNLSFQTVIVDAPKNKHWFHEIDWNYGQNVSETFVLAPYKFSCYTFLRSGSFFVTSLWLQSCGNVQALAFLQKYLEHLDRFFWNVHHEYFTMHTVLLQSFINIDLLVSTCETWDWELYIKNNWKGIFIEIELWLWDGLSLYLILLCLIHSLYQLAQTISSSPYLTLERLRFPLPVSRDLRDIFLFKFHLNV